MTYLLMSQASRGGTFEKRKEGASRKGQKKGVEKMVGVENVLAT